MKTSYSYNSFLAGLFMLLMTTSLSAQVVWPGDVNDNGIVNSVDVLYLSRVIGEEGPPRTIDQQGLEWGPKAISTPWGTNIPGTTVDYAFADSDGNGVINELDIDAIYFNYELEHGGVDLDVAIPGEQGADPSLFIDIDSDILFAQGGTLLLPIMLGTEELPVESFNGISFSVELDPEIVTEIFPFPINNGEEGWGEYELFPFLQPSPSEGKIDVAITPLGMESIMDESGLLMNLFIVIEDDVVDYQDPELETAVRLENIFMFAEDGSAVPVVNDTLMMTIVEDPLSNNNILDDQAVSLYPNPSQGTVYLETEQKMIGVDIYNSIGQQVQSFEAIAGELSEVRLDAASPGMYFFKIKTEKGILTKKIFLE